ncbi:MAG: hypothetical protein NTW29_15035 [Bacteroidetes bacterium]|nr:hypothetical protein [Bacteroidota bacterium]
MQAISKDKHERFSRLVQTVLVSRTGENSELIELKTELDNIFLTYRQTLEDIRTLIMEYDVKQKTMRQKMRQFLCSDDSGVVNSKT